MVTNSRTPMNSVGPITDFSKRKKIFQTNMAGPSLLSLYFVLQYEAGTGSQNHNST